MIDYIRKIYVRVDYSSKAIINYYQDDYHYSRSQKVGTSLSSSNSIGILALILLKPCSNFLASTVLAVLLPI